MSFTSFVMTVYEILWKFEANNLGEVSLMFILWFRLRKLNSKFPFYQTYKFKTTKWMMWISKCGCKNRAVSVGERNIIFGLDGHDEN